MDYITGLCSSILWFNVIWSCFFLADGDVCNPNVTTNFDEDPPLSAEARLVNSILEHYSRYGKVNRPVIDSSHPVRVQFGLRLIQVDLNESEQTMTTSVWIRLRWCDEHLRWNRSQHGGVKYLTLPTQQLWTPDITLVNTGEASFDENIYDLQVKYTGRVFWVVYRKYNSACLLDVTEYPFDKHTCHMWFQSMANYDWNLFLDKYYKSPFELDTYLDSFKDSRAWGAKDNRTERFETSHDAGVQLMYANRVSLRFSLTLVRRPGFKDLLLVIPCLLLSLMIPLIFCFPSERPDRNTMAMSLFACLMVLLLLVIETAPPSAASVPKLGIYYGYNLVSLILATFASAIVIKVSKKGSTGERVPTSVRKIFIDRLASLLCYRRNVQHMYSVRGPRESPVEFVDGADLEKTAIAAGDPQNDLDNPEQQRNAGKPIRRRPVQFDNSSPGGGPEVPKYVKAQWHTLSLVLDRLFFVIFLVANIIAIILFFPRPQ